MLIQFHVVLFVKCLQVFCPSLDLLHFLLGILKLFNRSQLSNHFLYLHPVNIFGVDLLRSTLPQFAHHVIMHQSLLLLLLHLGSLFLPVDCFNCIESILRLFPRLIPLQEGVFGLGRWFLLVYFPQGARLVGDQPIWWSILRHLSIWFGLTVFRNCLLVLLLSIEQYGRQWVFRWVYWGRWNIFGIWTIDWSPFSLGVFSGWSAMEDVENVVHSVLVKI